LLVNILFLFSQVKGRLIPHTTTAKVTIIFDLPIAKPAKTTIFAYFETKIAYFESRRSEGKEITSQDMI
jgi:hypothetical protein